MQGPIILIVILILIALCLSILIVPFHLYLSISKEGQSFEGIYRIAWFGRTLRKGVISSPSSLEETRALEKEEPKEKHGLNRMTPPDPRSLLDGLSAIFRVLGYLIQSMNIEKISCNIIVGLNDPMETAAMSGYLWALVSIVGLYRANISIEPCFVGERLEGNLMAEIKAKMLWIAMAIFRALKEETIRRLIEEMVRGRKRSENNAT